MAVNINESDLYKILGIDENSDSNTINKVYKKLAKEYHPDRYYSSSLEEKKKNEDIFSKMTSAYNILKDDIKRKQYDYERKLRLEYEKTLNNINSNNNFTFTKPVVVKKETEIRINVSSNKNNSNKGKASEETINANAELLYNTALTKISSKDYDGGILDLQTAIVVNGKIAKYHSTLGLVMKEKGWLAYANAEFKKALNIDPNDKLALRYYQDINTKEEEKNIDIELSFIQKLISFLKKLFN